MTNFISIADYDASIHREILDSLVREDISLVDICEDRAIAEMRSYLAKRYDCDSIFSQAGDNRHPLVLMMALDIAIYHIFSIHNPIKTYCNAVRALFRSIVVIPCLFKRNFNCFTCCSCKSHCRKQTQYHYAAEHKA